MSWFFKIDILNYTTIHCKLKFKIDLFTLKHHLECEKQKEALKVGYFPYHVSLLHFSLENILYFHLVDHVPSVFTFFDNHNKKLRAGMFLRI
jgi:hypothetical protein